MVLNEAMQDANQDQLLFVNQKLACTLVNVLKFNKNICYGLRRIRLVAHAVDDAKRNLNEIIVKEILPQVLVLRVSVFFIYKSEDVDISNIFVANLTVLHTLLRQVGGFRLYFVGNKFELGEADGEFALDEVALGAEPGVSGDFVPVVDNNIVVDVDFFRRTAFMPVLHRRVFFLLR